MMRCSHVRRQLAIFRELTPAQQAEVRRHLAGCRACTAAWEAYRSQDVALAEWAAPTAALPPARDAWAQVRARVEAGQVAESPMRRRPALAVAMVALALLLSLGGALRVAADTLPGQTLYPLKRAAEQARLALTWTEAGRARYASEMAQERRCEVMRVVAERRSARVRWEAVLASAEGGEWIVDGLSLAVGPEQWPGDPPAAGTWLAVEAEAHDGYLVAEAVQVIAGPDTQGKGAGPGGPEDEQGAGELRRDRDRDNRPPAAGTPMPAATPTVTPYGTTPTATLPVTLTPTMAATRTPSGHGGESAGEAGQGLATPGATSSRATVMLGARATAAAATSEARGGTDGQGHTSDGSGADGGAGNSGASSGGEGTAGGGAGKKD